MTQPVIFKTAYQSENLTIVARIKHDLYFNNQRRYTTFMKRKTFTVYQDGQAVSTTHAWNSALRAVIAVLRPQLNEDGETAEVFSTNHKKDMDGFYYEGSEVWHTSQGRTFVFEIKQTG